MFSWFTKTTELETFCEKLTVENAVIQFEGNENEDGLRGALAIVLIYAAYHFWQSIKETSELKKFAKNTSANVVIFETLVYVWSHVATEVEHFMEELGLDDDDPILEAITDSEGVRIFV